MVAQVYNATASVYTVSWRFSQVDTLALNNITFPSASPFVGLVNDYTVSTDPNFFKESFQYVFYLDILNPSPTTYASISVKFVLMMNNYPQSKDKLIDLDGYLYRIPDVGVYNSTEFLLSCKNWTDDNTNSTNLMYKFTYIDPNVNSTGKY